MYASSTISIGSRALRCAMCRSGALITADDVDRAKRDGTQPSSAAGLRLGWDYDAAAGHRLCQACALTEQSRYEAQLPCPDWCNECGGYDLSGPSIMHVRAWHLVDGQRVAELVQVVAPDGQVQEVASKFEPITPSSAAELRAVARIAGEVAEMLERYGLVLTA